MKAAFTSRTVCSRLKNLSLKILLAGTYAFSFARKSRNTVIGWSSYDFDPLRTISNISYLMIIRISLLHTRPMNCFWSFTIGIETAR